MKGKNPPQDQQVGPSWSKCIPHPGSNHHELNGETQVHAQLCQGNPNLTQTPAPSLPKGPLGTRPVPVSSTSPRGGLDFAQAWSGGILAPAPASTGLGKVSSSKHLVGLSPALQLRGFTPGSGKHFKDLLKHFAASEI